MNGRRVPSDAPEAMSLPWLGWISNLSCEGEKISFFFKHCHVRFIIFITSLPTLFLRVSHGY